MLSFFHSPTVTWELGLDPGFNAFSLRLDPKKVEFYRWADPVLGPRRTPNCEKPLEGLEPLATTSGQLFSLESGQVRYGGLELGPGLVFRMATS